MSRKRRGPASQRGYTLLEVMMSLSVLGIGAMGIVALQKATAFGNADARNLATANDIAIAWAERLRSDASGWVNTPTGDTLDTNTAWLKDVSDAPGLPSAWFFPEEIDPRGSPRADLLGADIFDGDDSAVAFCTQVRLTRVYPSLVRAEIRVYWDRDYDPVVCDEAPEDVSARFGEYGFVYLSTGIHQNVLPQ